MKKILLLLFTTFLMQAAFGQNGKFIQFKLYKNIEFELGQTAGTRTIELGVFSPAIAWGKGENFHEIQLLSINFFSRNQARNYSAGAEYSFNYRMSDEGVSKFQFFVGGGLGGSFQSNYSEIFRNSAQGFASSGKYLRFHGIVIPRVTYELRNNILLDLSLPYKFCAFENIRTNEQDPTIPVNQQTSTFNDFEALPRALSLKVGATVRF